MNHIKNISIALLLMLTFLLASLGAWIYSQIDSALPMLEGKESLLGLSGKTTIERDKQGIATITAQNRQDIAVATGFVHAQERFFQMDLLRRNAAGELSSLFGTVALAYDQKIRRHRFRERARDIVARLPNEQLLLLKAYTQGVNQGLKYLKTAPFEYLLLRQDPVEWQEEDTVLSVYSMYIDLQYADGDRERTIGLLNSVLGKDVFEFLNPRGSIWDAAIDETTFTPAPLPQRPWPSVSSLSHQYNPPPIGDDAEAFPGSNNWAIAGEISQTGSAMVANDMHLGLRVPNTWFRASFEYIADNQPVKVTGLTLPGTPNMVVGSNGNIAWGFTNSYGDWNDIIILTTSEDGRQYLTPEGYVDFSTHRQIIAIKDQESVKFETKETIWGPVIGKNHLGQLLAYRWVAHDLNAVNFKPLALELAKTVDDAFSIASRSGIPAQNMMVGDSQGNIGWTIMGPIPRKTGSLGDVPTSWADGKTGWQGYLSEQEYPKIKNPANHRLWSANARVVGGKMYEALGNGGYALGARASQIKADLLAQSTFDEPTLLAIALDDNAVFLQRWQQFLVTEVLTEKALKQRPDLAEIKTLITQQPLRAAVNSVAYRLVRNFRINVRELVFSEFNSILSQLDDGYSFHAIRHQIETPLWQLVSEQPDDFMLLAEPSWPQLFIKALDKTIADMSQNQPLSAATWGQQNTSNIRHPLSSGVPFIGHWLDMPSQQLPGDSYMPLVQGPAFGASMRMVVSPGFEERGIMQMPTSQSGHPWSPYYGIGHSDWEQGKASAFLPGKTEYTLTLLGY